MGFSDKDWLTTTLDCGDNSCHFRDKTKPGGMRTNGGCSCIDFTGPGASLKRYFVHKMLQWIHMQADRIKELEAELKNLKKQFDS